MRLQILEMYWDIGFGAIGFSLLTLGWYERALLALHFVTEDKEFGAQLTGSVLWIGFHIGGTQKDTLP
jgi:hypothetical protein